MLAAIEACRIGSPKTVGITFVAQHWPNACRGTETLCSSVAESGVIGGKVSRPDFCLAWNAEHRPVTCVVDHDRLWRIARGFVARRAGVGQTGKCVAPIVDAEVFPRHLAVLLITVFLQLGLPNRWPSSSNRTDALA